MTKRISAWLLDIILLTIAATGFGFLVSKAVGYDARYDELEAYYARYESEYGVSFHISEAELAALTPEETARIERASEAMNSDDGLKRAYVLTVNLTLVILSLGILLGFLLVELAIPLFFGNGQTVGKKVFGLCLMQKDQTKLRPVCLAIRTILGKYAVETMVPVLMIFMLLANMIGIAGTAVIVLISLLQLVLIIRTSSNSALHDIFADTVVVDAKSQKIFDDLKAKEDYKIKMEKGIL